DRRDHRRGEGRLRREEDRPGRTARRLAPDLRRARREGRDAGRVAAPRVGRFAARDPRARERRRAAAGAGQGVTLRRIESPTLVAWAAAVVGLIGIVSASTPEMADRYDLVRGVLPQGFPSAARVLTIPFGR